MFIEGRGRQVVAVLFCVGFSIVLSGCENGRAGDEGTIEGGGQQYDPVEQARAVQNEIRALEEEGKALEMKIESRQRQTAQLEKEQGVEAVQRRLEMMVRRLAMLQDELTGVELNKLNIESGIAVSGSGKDANSPDPAAVELERLRFYEARLRKMVAEQEAEIASLERSRRATGAIEQLQFQLQIDRELYGEVRRRLGQLQTEARLLRRLTAD